MPVYYPLLTLLSIAVFAWLGRRLAKSRNRNALAWGVGGALLPPALLALVMLRPLTTAEAAEDANDDTGELDED